MLENDKSFGVAYRAAGSRFGGDGSLLNESVVLEPRSSTDHCLEANTEDANHLLQADGWTHAIHRHE